MTPVSLFRYQSSAVASSKSFSRSCPWSGFCCIKLYKKPVKRRTHHHWSIERTPSKRLKLIWIWPIPTCPIHPLCTSKIDSCTRKKNRANTSSTPSIKNCPYWSWNSPKIYRLRRNSSAHWSKVRKNYSQLKSRKIKIFYQRLWIVSAKKENIWRHLSMWDRQLWFLTWSKVLASIWKLKIS